MPATKRNPLIGHRSGDFLVLLPLIRYLLHKSYSLLTGLYCSAVMKNTILLIDDEPRFCQSLTFLLEAEGFLVDAVHSGHEGESALQEGVYHGVILDMGLPDMPGTVLARHIVQQYPETAVIILTGENDAEKGLAAFRLGVFDYLVKPCDPDHLTRILHRALEQKLSERNLRDAYDIINFSPAIAFLWLKEEGWPVEFVSENVVSLCGYSAGDFISGQISYVEIIHAEDRNRVTGEVRQAEKDPQVEFFQHAPYRIVTRDGQVKWVEANTSLKRDGRGVISHYQGIVLDITRRKRDEEILRRSKQQWEKTFDAIPALIILQDKKMRILRANRAAIDFFQTGYRDILGKHCYQLFRHSEVPCDDCPILETLSDACSHTRIIEHTLWNRFFQVTSSPVIGEHGRITHLVYTAKDVTEQKHLEEHLLQAHKMEAIGTLAGGIAHDFNNLLTVILGSAEISKYGLKTGKDPGENLDQIVKAGRRASQLVKQLLAFSRKSEHKLQPFEPYLIVKEAVKMLRSSFPATVSIKETIEGESGIVVADPTRIYQIVVELCTNALHAMKNEKGMLTVELRRRHLETKDIPEQGVKAGSFVVLSVRDTGSGMDQITQHRVFDPYYTTKEVGSGSGLGLAVLHGIVRDYHGMIRVESVPGTGTVVEVFIPSLKDEQAPSVRTDEKISGSEQILLVDDESSIVSVQKIALESLGYYVTVTTDSVEAWETLQQQPGRFDLLITDQTMPRLSGIELAEKVLALRPGFPIILCTGYSALVSEQDALAIGIRRFVAKPVVGYELGRAVREILDQPVS